MVFFFTKKNVLKKNNGMAKLGARALQLRCCNLLLEFFHLTMEESYLNILPLLNSQD